MNLVTLYRSSYLTETIEQSVRYWALLLCQKFLDLLTLYSLWVLLSSIYTNAEHLALFEFTIMWPLDSAL
jgi:hypothetical protein